jgi:hypothetical protein
VIVYSREELSRKLLTPRRKSGRIQRRTPGSGLTVRGTGRGSGEQLSGIVCDPMNRPPAIRTKAAGILVSGVEAVRG